MTSSHLMTKNWVLTKKGFCCKIADINTGYSDNLRDLRGFIE